MDLKNGETDVPVGRCIPVAGIRLPSADELLPYLREIDNNRWYTNHGSLHERLQNRLSDLLPGNPAVALASSGTAALAGAILARTGRANRPGSKALVPSFTFAATALAAEQCGYEIALAGVDDSWLLNPEDLLDDPRLSEIDLVIPVGAMGKAVPQAPWLEFERRTSIPVVIDGAACIEQLQRTPSEFIGPIPVAVSFHATKPLACGEGGAVVCADNNLVDDAIAAMNFGFRDSREVRRAGFNGKMSEYHAAIGLASLDSWPDTCHLATKVALRYRQAASTGLQPFLHTGPEVASCYTLFSANSPAEARQIADHLRCVGVETRLWYGGGLASHSHFAAAPVVGRLAVTPGPTVLGLPFALDLPQCDVDRVTAGLATALMATRG